ncbi:uncharacterized protein A1O5_03919 [Cladophialophora psammophila CBS 110553]|uniref:Methyltransferase domain-containing protein n=1 Tax=Cladophialophora psammophila CBS 110553 TaxID=1182543 RepID=W9WX37_9EURO|nr:uncharacterized protein A1O5_03919 [Cladophialophora psammophila CBS 110553]EXJ72772.1 hypothetical protein A1O5_03919 [Cladophialophora psammophila CBS 110553]
MSPDDTSLTRSMDDLAISSRNRSDSLFTTYQPASVKMYGRIFASTIYDGGHCYYLPVDDEERYRQELCNSMWIEVGGHILGSLKDIRPGIFLDLGAGWGIWVQEVSSLIPGRQVVGLDIHYDATGFYTFENCSFEADNYEDPWVSRDQPVALVHLRDSYFSLRQPRELAKNVFEGLCDGGWFQNEEMRLENWTSESPKFNDWRLRTMEAARRLGVPLHSAQDIETSFREAGFGEGWKEKFCLEASGETAMSQKLLEVVKLTVKASVRILVEGGSCGSTDVCDFVEDVVKELEEGDHRITVEAEVYTARKPDFEGSPH